MSDFPISIQGPSPAPVAHTLASTERFTPMAVSAVFDGTGAAGSFLPCCSLYAPNGDLLGRTFPRGVTLNPGDVAEVTFAPF